MRREFHALLVLVSITTACLLFIAGRDANAIVIYKTKEVAMKNVDVKAIAKELLTSKSYSCFVKLVTAESHFNPKAVNSSSNAKGIGQLLPETYTNLGMRHSSDPKVQLIAMLAYIARHYGGVNGTCIALKHELKYHNY